MLALVATLSACSYTFDDNEPPLPLVERPLSLADRVTVPRGPDDTLVVRDDASGVPWVLIATHSQTDEVDTLSLIRLSDGMTTPTEDATRTFVSGRAVFLVNPDDDGARVVLRTPDEAFGVSLPQLAPGTFDIVASRDARSFAILPFGVGRLPVAVSLEGRRPTALDLDPIDARRLASLRLSRDGRSAMYTDSTGAVIVQSLLDDTRDSLGGDARLEDIATDADGQRALRCSGDGLEVAQRWGGSFTRDLTPCLRAWFVDGGEGASDWALFRDRERGALHALAIDDTLPPRVVATLGGDPVVARREQVVLSSTPPDRYHDGAVDGWLADRQIIERGRDITFDRRGAALLFLDRSATADDVGDLVRLSLLDGSRRILSRNVIRFVELSDGRIVAVGHRAASGPHNQLLLIDLDAGVDGERQLLASGIVDLVPLPGHDAVLAERYNLTGSKFAELVLLPIPEHTR